jgi:hypothetical protein
VIRTLVPAAALLALLTGCPLPQPLPEYPAGTVTPPRIVMDGISPEGTYVRVPASCSGAKPSYTLAAALVDNIEDESVTARWFVDYDPLSAATSRPEQEDIVPPAGDGAADPLRREVPSFAFVPYDYSPTVGATSSGPPYDDPNVVHVVELVVSNNFDPTGDPAGSGALLPYRSPATGFETQAFRWVFVLVLESTTVPCPL